MKNCPHCNKGISPIDRDAVSLGFRDVGQMIETLSKWGWKVSRIAVLLGRTDTYVRRFQVLSAQEMSTVSLTEMRRQAEEIAKLETPA